MDERDFQYLPSPRDLCIVIGVMLVGVSVVVVTTFYPWIIAGPLFIWLVVLRTNHRHDPRRARQPPDPP